MWHLSLVWISLKYKHRTRYFFLFTFDCTFELCVVDVKSSNLQCNVFFHLLGQGREVLFSTEMRKEWGGVLKIFTKFTGNTCGEVSFQQSCWPGACNFVKKRLQRQCFPVDLQTPFLWGTSRGCTSRDHSLITYANKSKVLILPPYELLSS